MAKLLLTISGAPDGMWPTQLFDDRDHLNDWLNTQKETNKLPNAELNGKTLTFDGGTGIIEEKSEDFINE